MHSEQSVYAQTHQAWLAQAKKPFAVRACHVLRKRPDTIVGFEQLTAALVQVVDDLRNRRHEAPHPVDASGRGQYGDGFALVDDAGVGLFVHVRETGGDDGPNYSYFRASSVGLDRLVLAADLALLHDTTLQPIRPLDVLTLDIQANLLPDAIEQLHATLARTGSRLGYVSDSHPHADTVDAFWKQPHWPTDPDLPLRRLVLQWVPTRAHPTIDNLLVALARIYTRLDDGAALHPLPLQTSGRAGIGRYFVLLRDATHGLKFVLDIVDEPEQSPLGRWGISLRSAGLHGLFLSSRRVMSLGVHEPPEAMQVETRMELCVTGSAPPQRLQSALDALAEEFASLGYAVSAIETATARRHPD